MKTFWKKDLIWNKSTKAQKTNPEDKCWRAFSSYIRTRDALATIGRPDVFKCISCGYATLVKGGDAGHYISRANKTLKYLPQNCHAQCAKCNRFQSGNVVEYRKAIIRIYGAQLVEWMENQHDISRTPTDWTETAKYWRDEKKNMEKNTQGMTQSEVKECFSAWRKIQKPEGFIFKL